MGRAGSILKHFFFALLDFRSEIDPELRRFKLLWVFSSLYEYIRLRGRRTQPLGLIIDEFASLCHKLPGGENPMAELLDDFINQYMRNHHIWLTVAHQSLYQLDEQLRYTLLSLGTYVIGRAATMSEARLLADVLYKTDPYLVKHWRKVWMSGGSLHGVPLDPYVVDVEPEFMPLEEQQERFAQRITKQGLFEFLLRPALREGEVSQEVIPISIANTVLDPDTGAQEFPDQAGVAKLRSLLTVHSGMPIKRLLAEQDAQLARQQLPPQRDHEKPRQPSTAATDEKTSAPGIAATTPPPLKQTHHASHHRRERIT